MSQQKNTYNAVAKENVAMVAAAYQQYQQAHGTSSSTKIGDLTPYMNYLAPSTSLVIDDTQTGNSSTCSAAYPCLILHNGSVIRYAASVSFGGTAINRAMWFHTDPNGTYSGTTNSDDKAVSFFLYYNGRIADQGNIIAGTATSVQSYSPNSSKVPPWFQW